MLVAHGGYVGCWEKRLSWLLGKEVDKDYCVGEKEGAHGGCS